MPLLAAGPALESVELLELGQNALRDDVVAALCDANLLANARSLDLSFCGIGPTRLAHLCERPLPLLEELVLATNSIDDEGVFALVRSPLLAQLRRLNLEFNELGADAYVALAEGPSCGRLEKLKLWRTGSFPRSRTALLSSIHLSEAVRENIKPQIDG